MIEIFAFIALMCVLCTFAWGGLSAAPWVPARRADVDRFIAIAHIAPGDRVYDLGCGDGRLVAAAARAGARATGFEISLFPYWLALIRAARTGARGPHIYFKNFWRAPIADADVVFVFLMSKAFDALKEKLLRELRPGTRVVSYVFKIPGWEPVATDQRPQRPPLYLYVIPSREESHVPLLPSSHA